MNELNTSISKIRIPQRMLSLPVSPKGYPVPWFVSWSEGVPNFLVIGPHRMQQATRQNLCWLCGQILGVYRAFVIGPMCCINRTSSEPPSHLECAEYAVAACPFLTNPRMRRNKAGLPEKIESPPGIMIEGNPGVSLIWVTRSYDLLISGKRKEKCLFRLGAPHKIFWYCEGRAASRVEIINSIDSGLPQLQAIAEAEGARATIELRRAVEDAKRWIPDRA